MPELITAVVCVWAAYWVYRAVRGIRDRRTHAARWDADRQRSRHDEPPAPDGLADVHDAWAAAWEHRYNLPAYDPNHHTTKGDQ